MITQAEMTAQTIAAIKNLKLAELKKICNLYGIEVTGNKEAHLAIVIQYVKQRHAWAANSQE